MQSVELCDAQHIREFLRGIDGDYRYMWDIYRGCFIVFMGDGVERMGECFEGSKMLLDSTFVNHTSENPWERVGLDNPFPKGAENSDVVVPDEAEVGEGR